MSDTDPVLAQRARIARIVSVGKRLGYSLFLAAIVMFVGGFVAGYNPTLTSLIVFALVAGSLVLAPSIVFGYGVRAAEREERGETRHGH